LAPDPKIPFKFLDPYKKDDIAFYYGREDDATALYEIVQKNRIVLVYGLSGTGKTSLIQCGLANKFNDSDWIPFYIRRKEDINNSLIDVLRESFPDTSRSPEQHELDIIRKKIFTAKTRANVNRSFFSEIGISFTEEEIRSIDQPVEEEVKSRIEYCVSKLVSYLLQVTERSMRPIYLVFDQLEELLMYGTPEEKSTFIESLKVITTTNRLITCHVIIIMREEFFAVFDKFEKEIPGITARRMRVDPMQENDIKNVLSKTLTYKPFNIKLEDPDRNIDDIFNALADKKGEVSLPYLQVYLDQLWREDFARDYPNGYEGSERYAPLTFTTDEIRQFGQIKDVLQKFLTARKTKIGDQLKAKFPEIPHDFINRVLKEFVSDYGTKLPILYEFVNEEYIFPEVTRKFFQDFPSEPLQYTLRKLEKNKLIRKEPKTLELSHDILAKVIDEQRDARERKRIRIRVVIKEYMKEKGASLSLLEVREWQNEIYNCNLSKEELAFFHRWRGIRMAEEADEQWTKKAKKMRFWTVLILLCIVAVTGIVVSLAYFKTRRFAYKYYALNFFNSRAISIPNKLDALKLGYYIYNKTSDIDNETREQVQDFILKLAADTSIQYGSAIHSLSLLSDKEFIPRNTMDISGDGKYFCVEYDSLKSGINTKRYRVYRTGTSEPMAQFDSIYYAYFVSHTDKLLLAVATDSNSRKLNFPNGFILLDCNEAVPSEGRAFFSLRENVLNVRDVSISRYSDFDSYEARITNAGDIMVPFVNLKDFNNSHKVIFLGRSGRQLSVPQETNYTVSNSRDNTLFMIGADKINGEGTSLRILDERGRPLGPFYSRVRWGDFTTDNSIMFVSGNRLYLANGPNKPSAFETRFSTVVTVSPLAFRYAYSVANETMALIETINNKLYLYSFTDSAQNRIYSGKLIGINHSENNMIMMPDSSIISRSARDRVIQKRSFLRGSDNLIDSINFSNRIMRVLFNEKRGRLAVETERDSQTDNAFVYILDSAFHRMGSFVIMPNYSYTFSDNGDYLMFVGDRQLNIFDLRKPMHDFSTFNNILDWMKINANDSVTEELRDRYNVNFPKLNIFR
jgi:hypothetical protein